MVYEEQMDKYYQPDLRVWENKHTPCVNSASTMNAGKTTVKAHMRGGVLLQVELQTSD